MSYQVLARKWRPQTFQEMMGQDHVLQALSNALQQNRLHHAYLFTGTRGVGKTSVARIFAKCLNCEQGVTATPCGTCDNCQAIEQGRCMDLIEVDAASRTSVEDTRELLDNVQYAPSSCRFKVYLIDEVHMLSGHSFNALLKTLEEPPEHVKFLLATTDPQKLPVTVLSRCLQFHLKNMLPEQITTHLETILQQEQVSYEQTALAQIARAADGSMRDALSLLDQAIAYANSDLTTQAVSQMLGTIEQTHLNHLLHLLITQDAAGIVGEINTLAEQGVDFASVLEELLTLLHQIALRLAIPDMELVNITDDVQALIPNISKEDAQLMYQIALIGRRDLPLAPTPKMGLEMVLLRMLAFRPAPANKTMPKQAVANKTKPEVAAVPPPPPPPPATTNLSTEDWPTLLSKLNLGGPVLALASHCSCQTFNNEGIELILDPGFKPLLNEERQQQIAQAVHEHLGQSIPLSITIGTAKQATPAQLKTQQTDAKQTAAKQSITNDPHVQTIMEQFDANIAPGSVKSIESDA